MRKNILFFITIKVQLITISSVIPYISEINSTSSSLKKKSQEREKKREREEEGVRTRRGRRRKRRKRGRDNEKEGEEEGEERRERERRGENGKSNTKNAPLSPDAFPSTKLGNNITPIKGRLGKNTTPTGRGPSEPN